MPIAEYYDELAEQALGWLGWSVEQALSSDVNAIAVGMSGRVAMFRAIFGTAEKPEPTALRPMTPELFDALF